jgi:hypothetical protein
MNAARRLMPLAVAAIVLAACSSPQATGPASSSPSGSAAASGSSAPTTTSSPPSASAEASPSAPTAGPGEPTAAAGDFSCELPIVEQATVARANIVDVRVGAHTGYDRVVFEFIGGTPEFTLERAEPPFHHDASGEEIDVPGDSFLRLTMRGGTKQTDTGESSYDGPLEFHPHGTQLQSLVEGGDFEGQSTWYIGLADDACVHVDLLDDEPRLVIDVEH